MAGCDTHAWHGKGSRATFPAFSLSYIWQHIEIGYVQGMCDLLAPLLVILDDGEWVALLRFPHTFVGMRGGICWAGDGPLQWEDPVLRGVEQLMAGSHLSLMLSDSWEPDLGTACIFCSGSCLSEANPCCVPPTVCVEQGGIFLLRGDGGVWRCGCRCSSVRAAEQ